MQWITVNGLTQTVISTNDTYKVLTAAYNDVTAEFTWTITPQTIQAVLVYNNRTLDKPAIEAMITTFESQPPPPPPEALDGTFDGSSSV
jgi:hypothetical protein